MINPSDIEKMDTVEGRKELNPEFLSEFENNKGDDKDE